MSGIINASETFMFDSILIANRGEIACRIIRTARRLGLRTISVYSRPDAGALHVRMADQACLIGPAAADQSYLNIEAILNAARKTEAQCIHPGYGFLSENAEFAEACAATGITFAGPPPSAIRSMGLKDEAKRIMAAAGVPVTPGYDGKDQNAATLAREAAAIGYPVLIKAIAGGGGKGMRRVEQQADFPAALSAAKREALASFGNDRVLLEKWINTPRHIEVQVLADTHGQIIHLNERDCSIQRRHQKVVEEAPASGISRDMRERLGLAAINAARAVNYCGAGTVEFIASGENFYFMEMNTRLQVEHPVTEAITGIDLVEQQIRVAAGEKLTIGQSDISVTGHAVEARVYAEDPANAFLPSTGRVAHLKLPSGGGIRVDTGIANGESISPWYDPMIAKIIAHGDDRRQALERLANALMSTQIAGIKTNTDFLHRVIRHSDFTKGEYTTAILDRPGALPPAYAPYTGDRLACLAALALVSRSNLSNPADEPASRSPWNTCDGFQLAGERRQNIRFQLDRVASEADLLWHDGELRAFAGNSSANMADYKAGLASGLILHTAGGIFVRGPDGYATVAMPIHEPASSRLEISHGAVLTPMHGRLTQILVKAGEKVSAGTALAIVEAMKMEHVLNAPADGIVTAIQAKEGEQVSQGDPIITLGKDNQTETAP